MELLELISIPKFSKELAADTNEQNTPRQVFNAAYSLVATKLPSKPKLVHLNEDYIKSLGLEPGHKSDVLQVISGAQPFGDFKAFAMNYGGHQFGHWAGQLGDGRAINILETEIKGKPLTLQLKGSGPTPYSRSADGLAVLRSSIREYLCSEAMFHLGVPTTRALSLVKTGDMVPRDMLYNGNVMEEQGAIVCRTSPSFIRFGNFELFKSRKEHQELKALVDHTITHHYPHLGGLNKESYIKFFKEVCIRTKEMIVQWQRVGFVHGVMNTDNLSILGLTIDYGPYGWLEDYDPNWTPNTTDRQHKRYRFGNQPNIGLWNLVQLANALYPLIEDAKPLQEALDAYKAGYLASYHVMMCEKVGLYQYDQVPKELIDSLVSSLESSEVDMTIFFRMLSGLEELNFDGFWKMITIASYLDSESLQAQESNWKSWFKEWSMLVETEDVLYANRSAHMNSVNPKYVLRNYMAQMAIEKAEEGDFSLVDELYQMLLKPYEEQPERAEWFAKRPEWAKHKVGCSMLSCSS